jgi:zinc/manganese transport system ATP-binding protein
MENHSKQILIENLTVAYGETIALQNVTGVIKPNSLMAIFGPNGGGKSTFVKVLSSLIKPTKGQITHQCQSTCMPAYLPQQSTMNRSFPITVREVVAMGLWHKVGAFKAFTKDHQGLIDQALSRVNLQGFDDRLIGTLSGGQFQRMLFARIILEDSSLIILDEPFTAIDLHTSEMLLALIHEWHKQGKTILVVLHDLEMARMHFPSAILLSKDCLGWGKTAQVLTDKNVMASYHSTQTNCTVCHA